MNKSSRTSGYIYWVIMIMILLSNIAFAQSKHGDNLGNHKASRDLNLNGNDVHNVTVLDAGGAVIGTASMVSNNSVILQVNSTSQAILIPRVNDLLNTATTPVTNAVEGMIVYDITTGKFYVRDNTGWVTYAITAQSNRQILVGGSNGKANAVNVTGDVSVENTGVTRINEEKVLSPMIKDGEIKTAELADAGLTTGKFEDAAVVTSKIQGGGAGNILTSNASGTVVWQDPSGRIIPALSDGQIIIGSGAGAPAGKNVSGDITLSNIGSTTIGANKITSARLAADAVSTDKITDSSLSSAKLAANAVTSIKLSSSSTTDADRAVGTDHVKDQAITLAKLGTSGTSDANKTYVTDVTGKVQIGSVDAARIGDGGIDNNEFEMLDGATSNIQVQIDYLVGLPVPVGAAVSWFPHLQTGLTLPPAFVECNGQTINDPESPLNGVTVPNLNTGSYLIGVSGTTGATVGDNSVTIAAANLPKISVTGATSSNNVQTPSGSVSIATGGSHSHSFPEALLAFTGGSANSNGKTGLGTRIDGTLSSGSHSHTATFSGNAMTAHSHPVSFDLNSDTQTSMENRPQSVTCRWIMRIK